jgi:cell division topological specificity factor
MNFFGLFKRREVQPATAPVARERLQVLLAHERASPGQPNLLGALKDEIINAITRHVSVKPDAVKVKIERRNSTAILRIAVDIPK